MRQQCIMIALVALSPLALAGPETTVVGFDGGDAQGFTGNAFFVDSGGNPGGNAHHSVDLFFNDLRTGGVGEPINEAFLGDYSPFTNVRFALDVRTDSLTNFFGDQITRSIGIALIDRDITGSGGSSGVFFELAPLSAAAQPDWTTLAVTIADPTQSALPAGWIGFGEFDAVTFEPTLPAGATFASVLAGVDEFKITGEVPGFFFTNAFFDVRIDNVALTVPGPATLSLAPVLLVARRRR